MEHQKKPLRHAAEIKASKTIERYTLQKLLTSDDKKPFMVKFLRDLSNRKGPWAEYYEFFRANWSGDVETMSPETRKYCEKFVKEVQEKYTEETK